MDKPYLFISDLINDLKRGRIRIPSFQRGFVWDPDRVAYFIDSIYKGFPFGSVLLWRTKTPLRTERNLGPYKLPESEEEYFIDYVLDGQQRITSIFGIFQNSLAPEKNQDTSWTDLFFQLNSKESVPFVYLDDPQNYDNNEFFPLRYVFNAPKYRQITRNLNEDIAEKIDDLVEKFTQATVPLERFQTEEQKYVATVFERINRKGVELNTFQLLSVWNWSGEFDLQEKFQELAENLQDFGFNELDSDLLLKCCSAVVNNSADPETFIQLPGDEVRKKFDEIKTGVFRTIDFLKSELNIFSLKLLPMDNILVVLTSFFASTQKQPPPVPIEQCETLKIWFWRSCFSGRYARGGVKSTDIDLKEVQKLKKNEKHNLGNFNVSINSNYFIKNKFRMSTIATTTFILLLANNQPLNFIQGTNISLEDVLCQGNRHEFHHIFPKAYLEKNGYKSDEINCLANISMLSRADNNKIKDNPPSEYRSQMPTDDSTLKKILGTHLCSQEMFSDDYDKFISMRADLLMQKAKELSKLT
ncbi:DUF262 domain-containing protein [Okeania sp. SIO2B3]|uniref:DUF262 domain-containing protein n=1 Tax=Okeania sp. SIO2B3 TaxID=2607784 RepID=UPI0013C17403|nr:DUF262 domain-containing protein [Okeania sp. SIO2B3]NET42538.1 DUF262 domain-containing protein [Okeania sp. SIO2B3]